MTIDRDALGSPEGFAAAYRRHAGAILIFLTRRTYDAETALDLTAETFARAFEGRRRYRGRTDEELSAWLFGIARHVLGGYLPRGHAERRALERLGIEVPPPEADDLERVVALAGLEDLREAVAEQLRVLPAGHQEAVRLRIVEELAYDDVARRLAITEQAARARASPAAARARPLPGPDHPEGAPGMTRDHESTGIAALGGEERVEDQLPDVAAAVDRKDPAATGRALTRAGYRVRWVLVQDATDGDRPTTSRPVAAPPAGTEVLAVLNDRGGNEVRPGLRELQVEIAPVGSDILESHR